MEYECLGTDVNDVSQKANFWLEKKTWKKISLKVSLSILIFQIKKIQISYYIIWIQKFYRLSLLSLLG